MDKTAIRAKATRRLKICAVVCLGLLGLLTISQFLSSYQIRQELVSPLIADTVGQQIQQQYLLHAVVSSIMLLIAVGIYLLKRYWWAILLVAITLVGDQYLNW
jgi:NADH:ubiquinone oxidoreductase subunit 6 (subunit J)